MDSAPRTDKKIPVSVIIMTRNEEGRIERCLEPLIDFDEVFVVDSNSTDNTKSIAEKAGAIVVNFTWNGRYPKKKQWCIDNLPVKNDMIFLVDADEVLTKALLQEISSLNHDGYFVRGRNVINGHALKFGQYNNKLCLFDRRKFAFPVIDDLDLPGMGEIEGHYQPVATAKDVSIGQIRQPLLHYAGDNWHARHERYAAWERGMNARNAWPADPVPWRQALKKTFRRLPGRPLWAFLHCYVFKRGFLDKKPGWDFACSRASYYAMISRR